MAADSPSTVCGVPNRGSACCLGGLRPHCAEARRTGEGAVPAEAAAPGRVDIGGVLIDNLTMEEALGRIEELVVRGQPTYVVTPNVDHIVRLQTDQAFQAAYGQAALVLADGMPVVWASWLLRTPLKQKVSGSDLFPRFCELAARKGYRLAFVGGRPGAALGAARVLCGRYAGLQVVLVECPPMGFENDARENQRLIERIRQSRADVLFVGLGSPKQELWMHRHHQDYRTPVSVGIGASFEFAAGLVPRAPRWLQRTGLEWAWRLMLEPRRMYQRYLIDDPRFLGIVWEQWCRMSRGKSSGLSG